MNSLSLYYLGVGFFKALLTFSQRKGQGERLFKENYENEGLISLTKEQQEYIKSAMNCIQCSRCNEISKVSGGRASRFIYQSPTQLFTFSRFISQIEIMEEYLQGIKKEDLKELMNICPVKIPFLELIDTYLTIIDNLKQIKT